MKQLLKKGIWGSLMLVASIAQAQLTLDVEGNYVFSIPYNVVRIPASGGTQFDLAKDLSANPTFTYRIRANYVIKKRHMISALFAPLSITSSGKLDRTIVYDNQVFENQEDLNALYKFNSYRLTYRYKVVDNPKLNLWLGLTGKVRDANIRISSMDKVAEFPNLGVVPLVNFYFLWSPFAKWVLIAEGDALATGQGRAEDIFVGVGRPLSKKVSIKGGYRILEGGANVERNYNFTLVNYASLGLIVHFDKSVKNRR